MKITTSGLALKRHGGVRLTGGGGPWYQNGSALANSLVAYWRMGEAGEQRNDSVGANHLTDNNTVGSVAGLVYPLAVTFVAANNESLSIVDNAALSTGDIDWWLAAWFYFLTTATSSTILSRYGGAANEREFWLGRVDGNINFSVYNNVGNPIGASIVAFTASAWHFAVAYHSVTGNTIALSIDAGAFSPVGTSGAPADTAAPLQIGSYSTPATGFWNGYIGPAMMGKNYIPTAADVNFLYNGGVGRV